jgi:glycosyltransferase involved in cell wall biosynthesis
VSFIFSTEIPKCTFQASIISGFRRSAGIIIFEFIMNQSRAVCMNGRFLNQELTGVQRYAHELLARLGPDLRVVRPEVALSPARSHVWEQFVLPRLCRGALLWSPGNTGPLAQANQVVTIHDASTLDHPEWFSGKFARWYRFLLPRLARRVRRIITVSEFSKRELVRLCDIPEEKVVAIYNGISARFQPASEKEKEAVRQRHGLVRPFCLYLGSLEPRKNVSVLLEAWKSLAPNGSELVLAGAASRVFRERGFTTLPPATRLLGRVDDKELPALLSAARCFVFPALYEGFGFPPLEAMACGTPVVCSNTTSLPEVCGPAFVPDDRFSTGAVFYFDPADVPGLAAQLARAMELPPALAERLSVNGRMRAGQFTWGRCADLTAAVLRELNN